MTGKVTVREVSIDEALKVERQIPEFDEYTRESYEEKYKGKEKLILVCYVGGKPAGYIVGYDRYGDGSFYCWMAAVIPQFRKLGVLKAMMGYQDSWARKKGYTKIRIKTRNYRREMLCYLMNYGFLLTGVEPRDNILENRILLERDLAVK